MTLTLSSASVAASFHASAVTSLGSDVVEKTNVIMRKILPPETHSVEVLQGALDNSPLITSLTIFVLAVIVGYHVVWRVTPALHSPLMAVTNAISSVIIVAALMTAGEQGFDFSKIMGFIAVTLCAINIFGGFMVTHRMLDMFRKKGK